MTQEQFFKNLTPPKGKIDVILDTDAYNEIDDQFAICYMLAHAEKFNIKGFCAAPFLNGRSVSAKDGMEKSYREILHLLTLAHRDDLSVITYLGSESYLGDEKTAVSSPAASFMAEISKNYSPENPLYIVAIGAITNVASAILHNPDMCENCVVIWLSGHALNFPYGAGEFNMKQDICAARVLFNCGIPLVQLPCMGIVDHFSTSKYELEHWLKGKNVLCDYLYENTVKEADSYAYQKPWTRVIWDVTAVAWLLNDNNIFMDDTLVASPVPEYDFQYATPSFASNRHFIKYVYNIKRDALFDDLFTRLINYKLELQK